MPTNRIAVRTLTTVGATAALTISSPGLAGAQAPLPTGPQPLLGAVPHGLTPLPQDSPPASALSAGTVDALVDELREDARRARARREQAGPTRRLRLTEAGRVVVPDGAPRRVRRLLQAANRIAHRPYVWGGGHGSWKASGYDCSGSVGYALHAAGVLDRFVTSGDLASYGKPGRGRWVTIYANAGHTYMVVAGVRFDTTAYKQTGSRWTRDTRDHGGYTVRHPAGL